MADSDVGAVEVAGGHLHITRFGAQQRSVLGIHGITASSMSMAVVARHLGGEYALLAPDLRGRGASAGLPGPYGMRAHADDCAGLLESAGLEGQDVGDAFYAYTTYAFGAILYRTHRRLSSEQLGIDPDVASFSSAAARPEDAPAASGATLEGIDRAIALTEADEASEERLFAIGLRRLLEGFGLHGDNR